MTAAHCIIKEFEYEYENQTYQQTVERNSFYPTEESMYKIYLGLHNHSDIYSESIAPAILASVDKIIVVLTL